MPNEYSHIAAYEGQEITAAMDRVLRDRDFLAWFKRTTGYRFPTLLRFFIVHLMRWSKDPLRLLDYKVVFRFLRSIETHSTQGLELHGEENIPAGGAFYITNHRDIILDAAFLSFLLRTKHDIRPYLGVGNNLFGKHWIEDLMRMCRCYSVVRNGGPKEVVRNAQILSQYIADKQAEGQSFWMAQREGRAKDGNDTTQPSVLKMLTLAHEDSNLLNAVRALHLTPVAITYDYDPCDYLKAKEMQLKRDDPAYRMTAREDMLNMQTGLKGQKGKLSFVITPCINPELDALESEWKAADTPPSRNEQLAAIASIIDRHIHRGYRLSHTNIAAKRILEGGSDQEMEAYIASRIALIRIPNKDEAFLRQRLLEMYANPAINQEKALA